MRLSARAAIQDPATIVQSLSAMNRSEISRRQRIMAQYQADVVVSDALEGRAGDNFVLDAAATRCYHKVMNLSRPHMHELLDAPAVENNPDGSELQIAPRLAANCSSSATAGRGQSTECS